MARIKTKRFSFSIEPEGVVSFNIYYKLTADGAITYDDPFVNIPAVEGQTRYSVEIPTVIPLIEGQYHLAVTALDEAGNESDLSSGLTYFFDFTAPFAPFDLVIE